jgi:long-chain acyl-CoA synthetase
MAEGYTNLPEFFQFVTAQYGSRSVLSWRKTEKNNSGVCDYDDISGDKLKELVYRLGISLEKFGLKKGDKAAIISESRFEWVVSDFACISKGIVTVPVYTTMTSDQIRFILEHSDCRICFVSNKMLAEKVNAVYSELPKLQKIISYNKIEVSAERIISFEELIYDELIHEKAPYNPVTADKYFSESASAAAPDDILTIIYTSGTTGTPKGVCLTHKNILCNVKQCTDSFPVLPEDRFLSFLPIAHTYERTGGYYVPLSKGSGIFYAQSIETLSAQMMEVKPTLVLAVPVLFNKMKSRILKNIDSLPALKRIIARKALKLGMKHRNNKDHFLWKLADKKVFAEIRAKTGGLVKFFISGGSALSKDVAEFFDSIGLLVLQGYGMTEASPVISVNRLEGRNKFGTVGLPLEGLEVKLAGDGEILVRGDNVMAGYYQNPKDTSEMIIDGWLHTGDIGMFDNEGFLMITDRKKTLIKTSAGKYISLTHIEDTLESSDYIDQVIL